MSDFTSSGSHPSGTPPEIDPKVILILAGAVVGSFIILIIFLKFCIFKRSDAETDMMTKEDGEKTLESKLKDHDASLITANGNFVASPEVKFLKK